VTRAHDTLSSIADEISGQLEVPLRLRFCAVATRDHAQDPRVFAHTHHVRGPWTICVCRALYHAPPAVRRGVLWHEIGHLLDGLAVPAAERPTATERHVADRVYADRPAAERAEEAKANARVRNLFGVRIRYNRDQVQEVGDE